MMAVSAQYYPSHPILGSENVILFYSEHEDWMKLWRRINASGGTPEPLLPELVRSNINRWIPPVSIYVSSNCSSIDLRDLSRINIRMEAVESFLKPTRLKLIRLR